MGRKQIGVKYGYKIVFNYARDRSDRPGFIHALGVKVGSREWQADPVMPAYQKPYACERGFHACATLEEALRHAASCFVSWTRSSRSLAVYRVALKGHVDIDHDDITKIAARHIRFIRRIPNSKLRKFQKRGFILLPMNHVWPDP